MILEEHVEHTKWHEYDPMDAYIPGHQRSYRIPAKNKTHGFAVVI
jgi:hypothetical protein